MNDLLLVLLGSAILCWVMFRNIFDDTHFI